MISADRPFISYIQINKCKLNACSFTKLQHDIYIYTSLKPTHLLPHRLFGRKTNILLNATKNYDFRVTNTQNQHFFIYNFVSLSFFKVIFWNRHALIHMAGRKTTDMDDKQTK